MTLRVGRLLAILFSDGKNLVELQLVWGMSSASGSARYWLEVKN